MSLPEPLVPAEADCRGLQFMPLDVVRLMDSDLFALSTGEEFKAAVAAWCKSWVQVPAGSLPDDDRVLAHLTGTAARWKKVKAMALHGFVKCADGRLYHPVVCEKAREAWMMRLRQRERSVKGNASRWGSPETPHSDPHSDPHGDPHKDGATIARDRDTVRDREKKAKGEAKQESHIETSESAAAREGFSKSERGLGRCAPLETPPLDTAKPAEAPPPTEEEKAEVAALVEQATAALTGNVSKGILDTAAYKAAVTESKFKTLVSKVGAWVGTGLDGPERWAAWEVMAEVERAEARSGMTPDVRKLFDKLVEMYRAADGSKAKAAA